jgi:ribonuclease HIII
MTIKENALRTISNFKSLLESSDYKTSALFEKDYNFEFETSLNHKKFKIQVYFGKKGVKTILQGDSSSPEFKTIQNLILDEPTLDLQQKPIAEPEEYIGSDECGKGDFFGPLVTAAVFVNASTQKKLKQIGVRDSKDLSEPQITELAGLIKEIVGDDIEVIKINPAKYNQLYDQFKNLNKLLNWAHSKAIDTLLLNTKCKTVITDKFSNKDLTVTSNAIHSSVKFIQEPRAEKYIGVAAASIIARNEFNRWFLDQKKLGHNFPKGASDLVISAANRLVIGGNDNLANYAKLHFKTAQKIQKNS